MGGLSRRRPLEMTRGDVPLSVHGVGLSLGSTDGIAATHLGGVKHVVERIEPGLVSEHLSWSSVGGTYLADLLPLPLTEEALEVVCRHVDQVQTHLKRRLLLENPSTYLRFRHSSIPEWEFLARVVERTGCGILCDVNNIYVSACNHGWDASTYLAALPPTAVGEIHLAGHAVKKFGDGHTLRIDDHGSRVAPAVWALYAGALARVRPLPALSGLDTHVPPLEVLLDETAHARVLLDRTEHEHLCADAA